MKTYDVNVIVTEQNVFKEEFCFECTSGFQTIQYDKIVVEQVQDCSAVITNKVFDKKVLAYTGTADMAVVAKGWQDVFGTEYPENCPITNCQMYEKDCETEYEGKLIELKKEHPWEVSASTNMFSGYIE